jgi:hypothetical protein
MRNRTFFFTICTLILFTGCNQSDKLPKEVDLLIKELNPDNQFKAALLIPKDGDQPSIELAESFFIANKANELILFVFTDGHNFDRLESGNLNQKNVFLDSQNRYASDIKKGNSEFPKALFFDPNETRLIPITQDKNSVYDSLLSATTLKFISIDIKDIIDQQPPQPKLSDEYSSVEYVRLDPENKFTIDIISNVHFTEDRIFVTEAQASRNAYIFDRAGNAIAKIECLGRGPDECFTFSNIGIDEERREVLVPDYINLKVLVYDFDGNLLRIIRTDFRISSLKVIDSLYFLRLRAAPTRETQEYRIVVVNREFEVVKEDLPSSISPRLSYITGTQFSASKNGVYYINPYTDTLFNINSTLQREPVLALDRGNFLPPPEIYKELSNHTKYASNYVFDTYYYIDSPSCYYRLKFGTDYIYGKVSLINGDNKVLYRFHYMSGGYLDDLEGGPDVKPRISMENWVHFSILEPIQILKDTYNNVIPGSELAKLREIVKIEDNPILRIYKK